MTRSHTSKNSQASPSLKHKHSKKHDRVPRPANAFFLFRSHYIANYTGPITQQTQLSRQAAEVWRAMKNDDEVKQHFKWEAKEGRHQHALNYPGWRYNNPNPGASTSVFEKDDRSAARSKEVIKVPQSRPELAAPCLSSSLRGLSTSPTPPLASPSSSLSSFRSTEISTPPTCIGFTLDDDLASGDKPFTSYWSNTDCLPNLQTFIEEPQTGFEVRNAATMWSDVDRSLSPLVLPHEPPELGFNYTSGNDLMMPLFGLSIEFDLTVTELDLLIGDEMGGLSYSFSDDNA